MAERRRWWPIMVLLAGVLAAAWAVPGCSKSKPKAEARSEAESSRAPRRTGGVNTEQYQERSRRRVAYDNPDETAEGAGPTTPAANAQSAAPLLGGLDHDTWARRQNKVDEMGESHADDGPDASRDDADGGQ